MTTMPKAIILYATEDKRHPALLEEALKTAQSAQASLIFYDIDAGSGFSSPRPTAWSADTDEEATHGSDLMEPNHLEAAGRHELALQVQNARDRGVEAFGWLPEDQSLDTLVEYADERGAGIIMVPADLAEANLIEKIMGRSLAHLEEHANTPLIIVGEDGTVETHSPQTA